MFTEVSEYLVEGASSLKEAAPSLPTSPTGKLALPSISQVQPRGFDDASWYHQTSTTDRLPALTQLHQPHTNYSSVSSSPGGASFGASSVTACGPESVTTYAPHNASYSTGLKTPSPEHIPSGHFRRDSAHPDLHSQNLNAAPYSTYDAQPGTYVSMNHSQGYMDVAQSHIPHSAPASGPPSAMSHYSGYQQPQTMQGAHSYGPAPSTYGSYSYTNGLAPLHSSGQPTPASIGSQLVQQPQVSIPTLATSGTGGAGGAIPHAFDTSGQVAPPGMKPRVTATLWEDEGSLCFQVEANGVCVARREGNRPNSSFRNLMLISSRQSYDQRHKVAQRCWHDQRPP